MTAAKTRSPTAADAGAEKAGLLLLHIVGRSEKYQGIENYIWLVRSACCGREYEITGRSIRERIARRIAGLPGGAKCPACSRARCADHMRKVAAARAKRRALEAANAPDAPRERWPIWTDIQRMAHCARWVNW